MWGTPCADLRGKRISVNKGFNVQRFFLARRDYVQLHNDIVHQLVEALRQTGQFIDSYRQEFAMLLAQELGPEIHSVERALSRRSQQTRAMAFAVIREQLTIADRFYALGSINKPVRVREAVSQFSSTLRSLA